MTRSELCEGPATSGLEDVRDFYEKMPYPAPVDNLDRDRDLYANPQRRRAQFHLIWPTELPRANREILVAGCGTSQAARYALREPDARVTAIDVSKTSLRHTLDLQRKYNLNNLELHHLPIEDVRKLARSFDLVVCTGVLHHMPDPDHGLRALRDVLRPQGAMRLMVYARYGRAGVYMMQEYCRLLGITASEDDLRGLGAVLAALSADHPISGVLRRAKDAGLPVTAAASINHLTLNEIDVGSYRTFCKVTPPLRREVDRKALAEALASGLIDVVMSDHNPQDVETKRLPFAEAAPGAIGIETMLAASLRLVHGGDLTLPALLKAMSTRPAELLGLPGGTLRPGSPADVVVFDPDAPWVLDRDDLKSKCKNTPFDEARLTGRVVRTIVAGRTVYEYV